MFIYPVLLLILTFFGAKISSRGEVAPDFPARRQSRMIEASACVGVVIHHVAQDITSYGRNPKGPITVFVYIGFLFTAIFFFFSGYGLMASLQTKPDYLKTFLQKRLPAVLIPFWIINAIGAVLVKQETIARPVYRYYGQTDAPAGPAEILKKIFGLTLVNSNGWFIIEIVILYLLFYAFFSLIKNKDAALFFMCASVGVIIAFAFLQGHDPEGGKVHWFRGEWWYNSTITFAFGLLFARFRKELSELFDRYHTALTAVSAVLTVGFTYASFYAVEHFGYYHEGFPTYVRDAMITLVIQMVTCIVFVVFVLLLNMRVSIGNRVLEYLGRIQLPLFLVHGYFVYSIFKHTPMSDFVRFAAVLASGIVCASVITPVSDFLAKNVTALLVRQRKTNDTLEALAAEELREKRSRKIKRILSAVIVFLFLAIPVLILAGRITSEKEYEKELAALAKAEIGDIVYFGRFDMDRHKIGRERLTWIVIKNSGNNLCLLSEKGIAGSYYNQRHLEVTWEESDLRKLLNSDEFTQMFSDSELGLIVPEGGDIITLLTPEEALEVFVTDKDRELAITDMAEFKGVNINIPSKANEWDMKGYRSSWWWLRGSSTEPSITAPIVTVDGEVVLSDKPVNKPGGAIRPVIWLTTE